jgi:TetR/AcrR family transcriptional regulator, transcriptional repressor for nem operon
MTTASPISRGAQTRERILDAAQASVLKKGFAAAGLDEIIATAGVTRSGFFYHFRDKHELAKALLDRYIAHDQVLLDDLFARVDALIDDPLHAYLAFLKMFAEVMTDLPERHPGCLVASYCYQDQIHSRDIRARSGEAMLAWRVRFRTRLDAIAAKYPQRLPVDLDALADMSITLVEGGILLDKGRGEREGLAKQVLMLREIIRTVFEP